jgi:crotonobetaine/carnitine-CoA ligase
MMRERNEMILADLIQIRAEQKPDLDVLTFEHLSLDGCATPDEVRTFADLSANGNRVAAGLIAKGVEPGDRFALMMRNHPEFVETMIAASITAGVFVPIDPRTRGEKLAFILRNSGCSGIVCGDYSLAEIDSVRDQVPDLKWIYAVETDEDTPPLSNFSGVDSLGSVLSQPATSVDVRTESPEAPFQIIYTSGTTGDPKGIVGAAGRFVSGGMVGALLGYQPDERPYTGLSMTHGNAQTFSLMPCITMCLRGVFSRRFTKSKLWDVCRHYGVTTFTLLGGVATGIYSEPAREDDADNPVRMVVSGGMPAAIWEAFERRFNVKVFELYGAVDGGGLAINPIGEGPVGSFGKPIAGLEMKILDENDNECAPGVVGEVCTRPDTGEPAQVEYFGNPEASKKKIRRGWNRSGDMGHRDEDGWLFFDYRAGGGIRHNGDFVNPGFVEKVIAEHPGVTDVFVYGVTAASGAPGEKDVVAAIVCSETESSAVPSIFSLCREKLESNFVPSYLQMVDEIPKTASEKPQEHVLLEKFAPNASNIHTEKRGG